MPKTYESINIMDSERLLERVVRVEEQTKRIIRIENKIDTLLETINTQFVTKKDLEKVRQDTKEELSRVRHKASKTDSRVWDLAFKVGSMSGMVGIITKLVGIW